MTYLVTHAWSTVFWQGVQRLPELFVHKVCPKANDPNSLCDVHVCDEVSETCAAQIAKGHAVYKDKVDAKRVLFKKSPIVYSKMKANIHGWA